MPARLSAPTSRLPSLATLRMALFKVNHAPSIMTGSLPTKLAICAHPSSKGRPTTFRRQDRTGAIDGLARFHPVRTGHRTVGIVNPRSPLQSMAWSVVIRERTPYQFEGTVDLSFDPKSIADWSP